jgi:hypothetical protein
LQVFGAQARIAHDAFQGFGMENSCGVKWNRSPLAFSILVDDMAAALARNRKTQFFPVRNRFRAQTGVGAWALDSNFNGRETHGNLGNLLTISEAVSNV